MATLSDNDRLAIEDAIFAGRKIEAIKLYREAVAGSGLAEAKQRVEELEAELRLAQPARFTAPPKKAGCISLVLAVIAVSLTGMLAIWFVHVMHEGR